MKGRRNEKGFSLLEVLIALSVFVIVVFGVYTVYDSGRATVARGQNKVEVQQTARVAMDMMASEIQTAGYDPSNAMNLLPTTPVQVANGSIITFIADVDGNNVTDQVTYRLQGAQLIRDFSSWNGATFPAPASEELANGVTTLTFGYFDGNDPNNQFAAPVPAASLAAIRRITVAVTTQGTAAGISSAQETFPLTMDVRLRNAQGSGAYTYQFTDKDKKVLKRDFTKTLAPGALAALDIKLASDVPGATAPPSCPAACYAYDPKGGDPASVDPKTLGYVGGLDSGNYGSGTKLENLVLQ
jgi:prepilin-type N-terminal cleavage/methylation domain-containing protein